MNAISTYKVSGVLNKVFRIAGVVINYTLPFILMVFQSKDEYNK